MNIYTTFHDASGRITGTLQSDADTAKLNRKLNPNFVAGKFDPDTHYVKDGVATARQANPAKLTGLSITGLPKPSVVTVEGVDYDVTDGQADLSFDQPGTYTVRVSSWPYLNKEFKVENPAS